MSWWGWIVAGAILLGSELAFVNAQFYLVFIGGSAIVTGVVAALVPGFEVWAQWALFAILVIVSMLACRRRVYDLVKGHPSAVDSGPAVGGVLIVPVSLAPGHTCQVEHAGSFWTMRNDGPVALAAGTKARIERVDGLTLVMRPAAAPDLTSSEQTKQAV